MTGATNGDNTRTDYTGGFSSFASWGYQVLGAGDSPAPVTCVTSGGSGNWFHGRALSVAIPNLGTSPVQVGKQSGSGGIATMPGAPTEGNILVVVWITEGGGRVDSGTGFSKIASYNIYDGTGSVMYAEVGMRCVGPGESANVNVADTAFSHWSFVSEWPV
jgi:hypothetical protein